jgi:hypothetical protein
MEYYSALKMKKILAHATTWINLTDIMLNEISQSQKDTYYMIAQICLAKSCQIYRQKEEWWLPWTETGKGGMQYEIRC